MHELLVPGHFDSSRVDEVWRVPYEPRAREARQWAVQHRSTARADDSFRVCLLAADVQNTFRIPGFLEHLGPARPRAPAESPPRDLSDWELAVLPMDS